MDKSHYITLIGSNTISNQNETSQNAISSNQDITINGQGSLTIISSKNGIKCDGKFYGLGGFLNIKAHNHGISSDSLYLTGIKINIEETGEGKDGLHAESDYDGISEVPSFDFLRGFVYIESGTINISKCSGDVIQADSFVYISGGNINIETEAIWETFTATSNRMKGCYSKIGDKYTKVSSDNVRRGRTYYILSNSCKGIKVGEIDYYLKDDESKTEQIVSSSFYTTLIEGGEIEINSIDDSIHTNSGNTLINGGKIKITTLDDGITADLNLIVNDGEIDIKTCYEGLEAQFIEINGGNIKIISDDFGINAAGENKPQILFSGGKTFVYAKGDGIDSNGDIIMNDGEVYVLQSGGGNGPLDSDGEIQINGGILVAVGSSGMPEIPSSSSKQCVIVRKISSTSDDVSLKRSNGGGPILSFLISSVFGVKVSYSLVILSSSSIKMCRSYEVVIGDSSNSVVTSGSSTVTTNVKSGFGPGWRPGSGGSESSNDGENCPEILPTDEIQSSISKSDSYNEDSFTKNMPSSDITSSDSAIQTSLSESNNYHKDSFTLNLPTSELHAETPEVNFGDPESTDEETTTVIKSSTATFDIKPTLPNYNSDFSEVSPSGGSSTPISSVKQSFESSENHHEDVFTKSFQTDIISPSIYETKSIYNEKTSNNNDVPEISQTIESLTEIFDIKSSIDGSKNHDDSPENNPLIKKEKGLSTGLIIGIVVVCGVVVILTVILFVYFIIIKKKRKIISSKEEELVPDEY